MMPGIGAAKRRNPGHHGSVTGFSINLFNALTHLQAIYRTVVEIQRPCAETLAPAVLLA